MPTDETLSPTALACRRLCNLIGWEWTVKIEALEDLTHTELLEWLELLASEAGVTLRAYCTTHYPENTTRGRVAL